MCKAIFQEKNIHSILILFHKMTTVNQILILIKAKKHFDSVKVHLYNSYYRELFATRTQVIFIPLEYFTKKMLIFHQNGKEEIITAYNGFFTGYPKKIIC